MGMSNVQPWFGGRMIRPLPLSARFPTAAASLIVCVAYYGAAVLSLRVALVLHQVTPIWPSTGIALAVNDIEATYQLLAEKGVKFSGPLQDMPWGDKATWLLDPDGNAFFFVGS